MISSQDDRMIARIWHGAVPATKGDVYLDRMRKVALPDYSRPQTLAYGLHDSPIGLAAGIVEKLRAWSDCDGEVERRFTKDEILTLVMIYWATGTINSANRYYFEASHTGEPLDLTGARSVPAAIAIFPKDISPAPRTWGERWLNLHRWTQMPRGGHFPAHEEPELLAEDLIAFFAPPYP
jgi:microsomal epoxide hydrolase